MNRVKSKKLIKSWNIINLFQGLDLWITPYKFLVYNW